MDVDAFINHRTRDGGGGGAGILKWKDPKESRTVDVWLHRKAPFTAVWSHGFPRIAEYQKDGRDIREVRPGSIVCVESEEVLRRQGFRDRDTDERETAPTICPMCLLAEHVRALVRDGAIKVTDVLFRVSPDESSRDVQLIHAGGFYGGFKEDKLTDEEMEALREARISLRDAWRETGVARCNYVFVVVDAEDTAEGVQIAREPGLLGDKMKEAIANEIERRKDRGYPIKNPYPFRWKNVPSEKVIHKRYAVNVLEEEASEELLQLITETDVPDLSRFTDPPNYRTLRAQLEQYCQFELDWNSIFAPIESKLDDSGFYASAAKPKATTASKPKPAAKPEPKQETKPAEAPVTTTRRKLSKPEPEPEPESEQTAANMIPCDECQEPMAEDQELCGKCGAKYEVAPKLAKPKPAATTKKKPAARRSVEDGAPGENDVPF